ncbi:HPF/RaiA family ribosome-associated protein [Hansschlegelia sp.]|uniref:HPF/RaiA family ribosome-associated protein n=1 Tax=Hansschlegelia sp. TaxID=2041892 RepID=UPI002D19A6A0|nr:HPF/RaiA family ribosome-associated protein [Hansschlegelia sp.]HVI28728.1 HPF/RaiA family ribosome-associated protein [Hansschlegelia sp.]
MNVPLEIAFKNLQTSEALERLIRDRVARLEQSHPRLMSCRVVVETPYRSAAGGKQPLGIAVEVTLPGAKPIVAKDSQERRDSKGDETAFVTRAFKRIERQLEDEAEIRRGDVKSHGSEAALGRVVRLFPEQNYGFVEYAGLPDLYFTRNAVSGDGYDQLKVGAMVRVTVAAGEGPMGPQASSVRPVGDMADVS